MQLLVRRPRFTWRTLGAIFILAILTCLFAYVYEMPGGISDWRMSHAIGLKGTMNIPLGKTPEAADQKFRHFSMMNVVHREPVDGGVLLFIKRFYKQDSADLQVEYIRHTWFGWKFVWGAGYGIGTHSLNHRIPALTYMNIPRVKGIATPFPVVCGDVLDPSVKKIVIETKGKSAIPYNAKLPDSPDKIWFALLPSSLATPYEIKAFNETGELVASKTIEDPQDSGLIELQEFAPPS